MIHTVLIAVGSNVHLNEHSPLSTTILAIRELSNIIHLPVASRLYRTPAYPSGSGPDYVNAVIRADHDCPTDDAPAAAKALLEQLHRIEGAFRRTRTTRWASRTLDLDLLAFGDLVLPDVQTQTHWHTLPAADQGRVAPSELILPHPRLQDRAFVLIPLCDVAPHWRHPRTHQRACDMAAALPEADRSAIVALPDHDQDADA